MNEAIRRFALFTRDLLAYDEQLIRIGRMNFEQAKLDRNYIVIDTLAPATAVVSSEAFDGAAEDMRYTTHYTQTITVDFYGDAQTATRAQEFCLRLRSQAASDLANTHLLSVHRATNIIDLKQLLGMEYGERSQVNLTIAYTNQLIIDTLRIDETQFTLLNHL